MKKIFFSLIILLAIVTFTITSSENILNIATGRLHNCNELFDVFRYNPTHLYFGYFQ